MSLIWDWSMMKVIETLSPWLTTIVPLSSNPLDVIIMTKDFAVGATAAFAVCTVRDPGMKVLGEPGTKLLLLYSFEAPTLVSMVLRARTTATKSSVRARNPCLLFKTAHLQDRRNGTLTSLRNRPENSSAR